MSRLIPGLAMDWVTGKSEVAFANEYTKSYESMPKPHEHLGLALGILDQVAD
jgi:hypothetical protein